MRGMKIGIVGGGAAGMMAAAAAQEANPAAEIFLIERNDGLGKKVIISGGGRCNVTTGIRDVRTLLTKYPRGGKFLTTAMYAFPPAAVYDWFEAHGVPLKTEDDHRVFPRSDDGHDVVRAFDRLFADGKVKTLLKAWVIRVEKTAEGFAVFFKGTDKPLVVDRLVLTTGGQAYRQTGSTGDGYAFAQALGHTITPLAPSLNAFFTRETWPKEISGLSFESAKISVVGKKKLTFTGPFLFTHKGVSGPAVFALSSLAAFEKYDAKNPLPIAINLFPSLMPAELEKAVATELETNPKKSLANALATLVPKSFSEVACRELGFAAQTRALDVGKKDRTRIVAWLSGIPLHVVARGAGDEFVTAGGVATDEVNPRTMESKRSPGLFFAGEILDVDGFTGGFNLQASWAAGRVAGTHAAA
jgi:hypothetical protein